MTDNSLFAEPEKDGFKHESPIRAFTSYTMAGGYFIGKGFRPSLQHLTEYLDAMERKEGYSLVQLLEAATGAPTMIFRRDPAWVGTDVYKQIADIVRNPTEGERRPIAMAALGAGYRQEEPWYSLGSNAPIPDDHYMEAAEYVIRRSHADQGKDQYADQVIADFRKRFAPPKNHASRSHASLASQLGFVMSSASMVRIKQLIAAFLDETRMKSAYGDNDGLAPDNVTVPGPAPSDDPVNPDHYAGRACADIGERLSANGYQILKYCWRLGKKDEPCQELGKALWYLESEDALLKTFRVPMVRAPSLLGLKPERVEKWFEDRIADQPQFTQNVARMLWQGYDRRRLQAIKECITEHRFHLECGRGLAV